MRSATNQACVAIIAGEASGDLHGAKLIHAMQTKNPGLFYCGIGGPALKQAGVRILVDAAELTVVGITEVFAKLPGIYDFSNLSNALGLSALWNSNRECIRFFASFHGTTMVFHNVPDNVKKQ